MLCNLPPDVVQPSLSHPVKLFQCWWRHIVWMQHQSGNGQLDPWALDFFVDFSLIFNVMCGHAHWNLECKLWPFGMLNFWRWRWPPWHVHTWVFLIAKRSNTQITWVRVYGFTAGCSQSDERPCMTFCGLSPGMPGTHNWMQGRFHFPVWCLHLSGNGLEFFFNIFLIA